MAAQMAGGDGPGDEVGKLVISLFARQLFVFQRWRPVSNQLPKISIKNTISYQTNLTLRELSFIACC